MLGRRLTRPVKIAVSDSKSGAASIRIGFSPVGGSQPLGTLTDRPARSLVRGRTAEAAPGGDSAGAPGAARVPRMSPHPVLLPAPGLRMHPDGSGPRPRDRTGPLQLSAGRG
ncbi:hypothetical protein SAM40697_5605 [Streptomyces ambofaciens]|uniref:Uncharacterized protein n=1 Tax=Streptomyces ambofaciens TaxID=1889 RepID=A0ABM6B6V7_STRAM|nr:hypothetical protein SAM40697_5605 [Streptomyces ambofaciens]